MITLPHQDNPGQTHWEGCWADPGHHNCAVRHIVKLKTEHLGDITRPLAQARREFTQAYVAAVRAKVGGDLRDTADALRVSLRSVYRHLGGP